MAIDLIAVLPIKKGSEDRAAEVLNDMAAKVKANEPNCHRYQPFSGATRAGDPVVVVTERYTDSAAIETHRATDHYKNVMKTAEAEGLLSGAMVVNVVSPLSNGFESR